MNIAVIGSGISGLACAHYLSASHTVTLFEANRRLGGHTATMDVQLGTRRFAIDTGFIVFNDWTYPNFIALMKELGVSSRPTTMGFSVRDEQSGLEYAGGSLDALFAQRRNLLSPRFLRMVRDILRFNRESVADLESGRLDDAMTLGDYLDRGGYSAGFRRDYLIAMGSAIWSSDCASVEEFPLQFFVRFFRNHGLLSIRNRPQWRVIEGGSREYIRPLCRRFEGRIHCATPIRGVLPYRDNDVVLHTDTRLLPRQRKTWSSWNYRLGVDESQAVLTYNMNILQGISAPKTFCVTLNNTDAINPHKVLGRFNYAHPVFTRAGMRAQQRWAEINGQRRTWYCGAYWHNGFHEDGVASALRVARAIDDPARAVA